MIFELSTRDFLMLSLLALAVATNGLVISLELGNIKNTLKELVKQNSQVSERMQSQTEEARTHSLNVLTRNVKHTRTCTTCTRTTSKQ